MAAQVPPELRRIRTAIGLSVRWRYFGARRRRRIQQIRTRRCQQNFSPGQRAICRRRTISIWRSTARIGDHYNFRLGVNNIFDREPPIVGANGAARDQRLPGWSCNGNT